jgi:hypothetical protein
MAEVVDFPEPPHLIPDGDTAWRAIELYLTDKGIPLPTADDDSPTFFECLEPYGLWDDPTFRDLMTTLTLACLRATAEGREMLREVAEVRKVA